MTGKFKWFNTDKGFGFITGSDGKDVFVHHSQIPASVDRDDLGHKIVAEQAACEFEIEDSPKGPRAKSVVILA